MSRSERYRKKLDPDVIKSRFNSQRKTMKQRGKISQVELSILQDRINKLCNDLGVPNNLIFFYISFAEQLYSLKSKFSGDSMISEAQLKFNIWSARGLDSDVLCKIMQTFNIGCVIPEICFTLDVSELDVGVLC